MRDYNELHNSILKLQDGNYIHNTHKRLEAIAWYIVEYSINGQDITYCSTLENIQYIKYLIRLYFSSFNVIKVNAPNVYSASASFENWMPPTGLTFYELDCEFKCMRGLLTSTIELVVRLENAGLVCPYKIIDLDCSVKFEHAPERILHAKWTLETMNDAARCTGFDVERELEHKLQQEILIETTKEIANLARVPHHLLL